MGFSCVPARQMKSPGHEASVSKCARDSLTKLGIPVSNQTYVFILSAVEKGIAARMIRLSLKTGTSARPTEKSTPLYCVLWKRRVAGCATLSRPGSAAIHQVRARHQPSNGQAPRHRGAAGSTRARR
jgi:hypothetical protein